jgi:hypothetical protein
MHQNKKKITLKKKIKSIAGGLITPLRSPSYLPLI